MGARRPVAEVQVTVIVMMMVVAVIVAMFVLGVSSKAPGCTK